MTVYWRKLSVVAKSEISDAHGVRYLSVTFQKAQHTCKLGYANTIFHSGNGKQLRLSYSIYILFGNWYKNKMRTQPWALKYRENIGYKSVISVCNYKAA